MRVRALAVAATAAVLVPLGLQAVTASVSAALPPLPVADGQGPWADSVAGVAATPQSDGAPVPASRNDPRRALGPAEDTKAEGTFYSTGVAGSVVLGFDNNICNSSSTDLDISIREVTFSPPDPAYPQEKYLVEVAKAAGGPWTAIATLQNRDAQVSIPGSGGIYKFVRITDKTNPADFVAKGIVADGVDVDGVKALNTNCAPPVFDCSAQALKAGLPLLGAINLATANPTSRPCKDDAATFLSTRLIPGLEPQIVANVLNASTDATPGGVKGGKATSSVADASIARIGFKAGAVTSTATVSCDGTTPKLVGSSQVLGATLLGVAIDANATVTLATPVGTLYINKTITTPTSLTQRAVWLDVAPLLELLLKDVIIGQASVGYQTSAYGNPCSA